MGTTTFSGPIKAGDIFNTSGTTVGTDVANVGFVTMTQSAPFTQATNVGSEGVYKTDIVIPAGSQIVNIVFTVTAALTGVSKAAALGTSSGADDLTYAVTLSSEGTYGALDLTGGLGKPAKWANVGANDVRVWVNSTNTGDGVGIVSVSYLQAIDLTA